MLDARSHQDGEAARLYGAAGIAGGVQRSGLVSLTYQNIGEVFTLFVKTCLAPNYLEPQEQALSDLLPRSTVARFNVDAFYRPDMQHPLGGLRDRHQGARRRGSSTVGARTGRAGTG